MAISTPPPPPPRPPLNELGCGVLMYSKTSLQVNTLYALFIYKMLSSLNYKLFTWHRG